MTGQDDPLLLPHEVAAQLGVTTATLRSYERNGWLKATKLPSGHRRYRQSDVDALLGELQGQEGAGEL